MYFPPQCQTIFPILYSFLERLKFILTRSLYTFIIINASFTMPRKVIKAVFKVDFQLIGIAANMPDYQMAWHINQALSIHLIREKDHQLLFTKGDYIYNTKFKHQNENSSFTLFKNRAVESDGQYYLLPEVKNIDYLLMIKDETEIIEILDVRSTLSKIKNVILSKVIAVNQLKSVENLIDE